MSGGGNGGMRNGNSTLEIINAAATAIASAESWVPSPAVQKRRWSNFWGIFWCFGFQKNRKRFRHAVLVPEPTSPGRGTAVAPTENATQQPAVRIPFVAPPSSPASFLPSESPSAVQSPAGSVSLSCISANIYSPGGPRSIFAIGPYAHETQLVTPPIFSTYTTEPSTAPFTPPPESVHWTTPSSPEVPFAQFLDPIHRTGDAAPRFPSPHYDFQSYLLHPGSPVGPLISPSSAVSGSGTSSPFPDREFQGAVPYYPDIRYGVPPKVFALEVGTNHKASGSVTPDAVRPKSRDCFLLDRLGSVVSPLPNLANGHHSNGVLIDNRVSFDLSPRDAKCVEKKPTALPKALQKLDSRVDDSSNLVDENADARTAEEPPANGKEGQQHQKQRATPLGSTKEFDFDHVSRVSSHDKPCMSSSWWANEKVVGNEGEVCQNWSFFPMMQQGVS